MLTWKVEKVRQKRVVETATRKFNFRKSVRRMGEVSFCTPNASLRYVVIAWLPCVTHASCSPERREKKTTIIEEKNSPWCIYWGFCLRMTLTAPFLLIFQWAPQFCSWTSTEKVVMNSLGKRSMEFLGLKNVSVLSYFSKGSFL